MTDRNTKIPRPFSFKELGSGEVVEEAAVEYRGWAPSIQVLKFEDGREMLRFCYYVESGQMARRALVIDEGDVDKLREEIRKKPRVREFLEQLLPRDNDR